MTDQEYVISITEVAVSTPVVNYILPEWFGNMLVAGNGVSQDKRTRGQNGAREALAEDLTQVYRRMEKSGVTIKPGHLTIALLSEQEPT